MSEFWGMKTIFKMKYYNINENFEIFISLFIIKYLYLAP